MVFGRKKKQEQEVVEEETPNQGDDLAEDDLALAYGNEDLDDLNDDSSAGDSIPPPPPNHVDEGGTTKQDLSHDDSRTLEDSPSIEANDVGVSMLSDQSMEEKKEADPSKNKKLLLIFLCFVSFCVLLGLAIKYGLSRKQSDVNASLNAGLEDVNENGSFDSPIADGDEKIEESTSTTTSPITIPEEDTSDTDVVQDTPKDANTATDTTTEVEVDTTPTTSVDQIPAVGEQTIAPTIDSSMVTTQAATQVGTSGNTNVATSFFTGGTTDDIECITDEISVSSSCENGVTSASINICLFDNISDQYWAWVDTPREYAPFVARDWGWLRDGTKREMSGLPEGTYVLGLYSNGEETLDEYPLITSTEFTITCSE